MVLIDLVPACTQRLFIYCLVETNLTECVAWLLLSPKLEAITWSKISCSTSDVSSSTTTTSLGTLLGTSLGGYINKQ